MLSTDSNHLFCKFPSASKLQHALSEFDNTLYKDIKDIEDDIIGYIQGPR